VVRITLRRDHEPGSPGSGAGGGGGHGERRGGDGGGGGGGGGSGGGGGGEDLFKFDLMGMLFPRPPPPR
jgi:hypothetical protein